MTGKVVTLYLDNTQIRLLVASGKRIKKVAELPLELSSTKIKPEVREQEIAAKIKQLLKAKKVNAKKIVLGLSGLHCLTRPFTLPQLPKAMQDEAVMREAKRALPIPPEQLYISWQLFPGLVDEGKTRGFLVAMPRKYADTILNILQQVGLKPYQIDLKPLALTRLVPEATAIVVDIQNADFDIVILSNGVPQPVRTVPFPNDTQSQPEKIALVRDEISRTIEFYNSNNAETPLDSQVTLYLSGELDDLPGAAANLARELNLPAKLLTSPLKSPKELDPTHYLVNIGLALKESSHKEAGPTQVNVNALPAPYRPKPFPFMKLVTLPAAGAIIGIMIMMAMFIQDASAGIVSARTQLDTTNQIIKTKQTQKKDLTDSIASLKKRVAATEALSRSFLAAKETIDRQGSIINGDLTTTTKTLVADMTLNGISHSGSTVTLRGNAASEQEILTYARNLDKSGRFKELTIASITRSSGLEGEVMMEFTISLKTGNLEEK